MSLLWTKKRRNGHSLIYPQELECKKENDGLLDASFLDLEASLIPEEGSFDYHLYDKRDGFNFFIVRFPYACSNIPSKIFLSTIGAETLRICRASSCFEHFIRFCQPFFSRMINQGANVREIKSGFHISIPWNAEINNSPLLICMIKNNQIRLVELNTTTSEKLKVPGVRNTDCTAFEGIQSHVC